MEPDDDYLLTELISLACKKEIPYTQSQLKKMKPEKLEQVFDEFKKRELDEFNESLVDLVIIKLEQLMKNFSLVKESSQLAKKLQDKKLFRKDVKKLISYLTPLLPYVGLIEGGLAISTEIFEKYFDEVNNKNASSFETKEGSDECQDQESDSDNNK